MEAGVKWIRDVKFVTIPSLKSGLLNSGGEGVEPMRLLLIALTGCTAMDVITILRKKRVEVKEFEVWARGERRERHPRFFKRIQLTYRLKAEGKCFEQFERAVELSLSKYCSVSAMLKEKAVIEKRLELF